MSNAISWSLHATVKDGKLDAAHALARELVESSRAETGTLHYDAFLNADGTTCHFVERYADNDAGLLHLGNFGANFAGRFMDCFTPTAFYVYGEPSDAIKAVTDSFGAHYFGTLGGV